MTVVTSKAFTDEGLRDALDHALLPALLPALGLLTGDWDALEPLRPARYRVVDEQGGMTAEQQQAAREVAFDVLRRWLDGELPERPVDRAAVIEGLRPLLGEDFDDYCALSLEELAIDDPDPRAPEWSVPPRPDEEALDAVVVGAGMSGLLAAHRLRQAGVRLAVIEKNGDVGGTWLENAYPGCRVDVPSHLYSYSCLRDQDWAHGFGTRDEVQQAFGAFADARELRGHVRFATEVLAAVFDEDTLRWTITVRDAAGERTLSAAILVSAVGQLNRPKVPEIPGAERFTGPRLHSAAWDPELPVAGRRFAVVGTGASAIQVVTGLLDEGATVDVFQRSPAWLFPTPDLREPLAEGHRWLLQHVPTYARWYRLWQHRAVSDGLLPFAECDPGWEDPRSVSAINDTVRKALTAYIRGQFEDMPELLGDMLPDYPPFAKRVIRDDGSWAQAFRGGGARLVSTPIDQITADGIRTTDGADHRVDGIVYATGFHASDFLVPMEVRGRGGVSLHDHWQGDASAYLGVTVPGFPNLFLLYGPNTNIVVNGSAIFFTECQVTYLLDAARRVLEAGACALDCRPEVHDAFRAQIDDMNGRRAWGCAGVRNWYTNAAGRVSQNWPGTALEYWSRTRTLDPADYHLMQNREDTRA